MAEPEDDVVIGPSEEEAFTEAFQKPEKGGIVRDEAGRFASREEQPEPEQPPQEEAPIQELPQEEQWVEEPPPEEQVTVTDDEGRRHTVPLHVHLDEREKRQKAEARAEQISRELEAQRLQWQRAQAPPPEIDPIQDPKAFRQQVLEEARRETRNQNLNTSFARAHREYGEDFLQAFNELEMETRRGNRMLTNKITTSPDPAGELMQWHWEQQALREVGGDIHAYRERIRQEAIANAMQDPEFHRYYASVMNQQARLNGRQSYPRSDAQNVTDLPSLNRATGTGGVQVDPGLGSTEGEVFSNAFARPRR